MARICVGIRAAALSLGRHHGDVQQYMEAGLQAAAAAGADAEQPASPPAEATRRLQQVQSGYGLSSLVSGSASAAANGSAHGSGSPGAAGRPPLAPAPAPPMTRQL